MGTGHGLNLYGHGIGEHGLNLYEDHGYPSSGHDHGHDHGVVHTGEYETHIHDLEHSHPVESEPEPELCYRSKAGIKGGTYVECDELDDNYYGGYYGGKKTAKKAYYTEDLPLKDPKAVKA